MTFIQFEDREDKQPIAIRLDSIVAVKKAISLSMVIGDPDEQLTLIRCKDNVTYQIDTPYLEVLEAIVMADQE